MLGCYNTYRIERDEFVKLQRLDEGSSARVATKAKKNLEVTRQSLLYVRSKGGRRYPITPFNFKVTSSQLVAPDRDYLLMLNQLHAYEIDVPSKGKTIALIAGGVAVAAGLIVVLIVTSGQKSFTNSQ